MAPRVYFYVICILVMSHECNAGYSSYTADQIRTKFKMLIQDLYYDAHSKVNKIEFIKRWLYYGKDRQSARSADMIYDTKRQYLNLVRMFVDTMKGVNEGGLKNVKDFSLKKLYLRMIYAKRVAMHLDHRVHMIYEFSGTDPSRRFFGRRYGDLDVGNQTSDQIGNSEFKFRVPEDVSDDSKFQVPKEVLESDRKKVHDLISKKMRNWAKLHGYNTTNLEELLRPKYDEGDGFDSDLD